MTKLGKEIEINQSRRKRIINRLRSNLSIDKSTASDNELLRITSGSLTRNLVEIEIAKEDFAAAVKPFIEKTSKDINRALSKFRVR